MIKIKTLIIDYFQTRLQEDSFYLLSQSDTFDLMRVWNHRSDNKNIMIVSSTAF